MRFIVATCDYSGLGFAIRLQDDGHEVLLATNPSATDRDNAAYDLVGRNMIEKGDLQDLMSARTDHCDAYWIWDHNHSVEENETLRAEGFRVLGGGRYADRMEHDRHACLEHAASYGLLAPPSHRFDKARFAQLADDLHEVITGDVVSASDFGNRRQALRCSRQMDQDA